MTLTELSELPEGTETSLPGDGPLYAFDVAVPESVTDVRSTIRLALTNETLGDATPDRVQIAHRTDGSWVLLETHVVAIQDESVTFEAETDGFSAFAVVATDERTTTATVNGSQQTTDDATTTATATKERTPTIRERTPETTSAVTTSESREIYTHPSFALLIGVLIVFGVGVLQWRAD